MTTNTPEKLLTSNQAADFLGISHGTLDVWRCNKRYSIPYIKIGRLVKYKMSDLINFLDDRTRGGEENES
jgi:hypothetical protein